MTATVEPSRLGTRLRRSVLVVHIVAGAGWMGLDVGLAALLVTARATDDPVLAAACYRVVGVVVPVPVTTLALMMLVTGVALGLGTRWGLLRYWWVAVKLAIGVVLNLLVVVALLPEATSLPVVTAGGTAGDVRRVVGDAGSQLLYPPFVSFAALAVALALSVFKPWGRTPRGRPHGAGRDGSLVGGAVPRPSARRRPGPRRAGGPTSWRRPGRLPRGPS